MSRLMVPAAAVAAAAAIVTAGCASAGASGPGSVDGAARSSPANAVAFVAASTDLGVGAVARRRQAVRAEQLQELASRPALGDELDVAVLAGQADRRRSRSRRTARSSHALAKKHRLQDARARRLDRDREDDGRAGRGREREDASLADNDALRAAMKRLPSDALVRAYANGAEAHAAARVDPGQLRDVAAAARRALPVQRRSGQRPAPQRRHDRVPLGRGRAHEHGDGLKLEAFAKPTGSTAAGPPRYIVQPSAPYASALADEIPSGALAVVDFQVAERRVRDHAEAAAAAHEALRRRTRRLAAAARRAARRRDGDLRAAVRCRCPR